MQGSSGRLVRCADAVKSIGRHACRRGAIAAGVLAHATLPALALAPRAEAREVATEVINKQPINAVMDDRLYTYLLAHTREPEVLRRIREDTATMQGARMQVSPEQGQFMALLAKLIGAKRYLELGVFTGYSSTAVAMALPEDGVVVALDRDPAPVNKARNYWAAAGVSGKVDCRIAPASESLVDVVKDYGPDSFDFAFLDADKRGYRDYYETLLTLVRPGGLIAVDNVLWRGLVADPQVTDKATVAIRDLNDFLLKDQRIDLSIVPIGDGIALCRRKE